MLHVPLNQPLSPNFQVWEAARSMTASRLGIDNSPPIDVMPALRAVAHNICEPLRDRFGPFTPTSWYRCLDLNRAIGSKDTSQHVKGQAADIEIAGVDNIDLARFVEAHLDFDQLILEFWQKGVPGAGWVHASYVSEALNRQQVLTISAGMTRIGLPV